ncbi:DNA repair protein [Moraxella caviae]|uniref:DNA repair protein n=1 Tax=Moraxella caviae TaxID=34060 RepID=A0A1T0A573_9GAMM|nr:DNA repair protein [Moraxella caviae]OOR90847.1 DNA repair protein [Moraxella caviae]STZ10682.1 Tellurite resistance protein TerB [Moraxella caviae]
MFVRNLTVAQQSALIFLAKEVAKADGNLDELQSGMAEILIQQSDKGVVETTISIDELPLLFTTERAKCSLILELLGVAHANNNYHVNEKDLIGQYAGALNISANKLLQLEAWVENQIALSKQAEYLLGE